MSSGVSYLWINSPANGSFHSSPAFPSVMLTILNDLIVFLAIVVAIFVWIELIPALGTYTTSANTKMSKKFLVYGLLISLRKWLAAMMPCVLLCCTNLSTLHN